mmetsp:Transcript_74313/g.145160  ORF Transcript_74313/g.145160 Transcript_74313/m.145160 type:complete len:102 (+) Transcript_74313:930-1235(+)
MREFPYQGLSILCVTHALHFVTPCNSYCLLMQITRYLFTLQNLVEILLLFPRKRYHLGLLIAQLTLKIFSIMMGHSFNSKRGLTNPKKKDFTGMLLTLLYH